MSVGAPAMGIRYETSACCSGWLPWVRPVSESRQTPWSARVFTRPTSRQSKDRIMPSPGFGRQSHLAGTLEQAVDGVAKTLHLADGAAPQRRLAGVIECQHALVAKVFAIEPG